jgi:hypothetical protein
LKVNRHNESKKEQLRKQILGLIKQYGDLNTQEEEGVFMSGSTVIPPSGKVNGSLDNTGNVMNNTFWVGIYLGLGNEQIEYIRQELARIVRK